MKNMVLGILGIFIGIYTIVVSLSIYSMQTRKNELENCLSQVVKHTLETYYESGYDFLSTTTIWESDIEDEIEEEMMARLQADSKVVVEVLDMDFQMGILSVSASEIFYLPNGCEKCIKVVKTAVVDQKTQTEQCTVSYFVQGNLYNQYILRQGEVLPIPKSPDGQFLGWKNKLTGAWMNTASKDVVNSDLLWEAVYE